ncbi:MAG: hypothetical protein RE472_01065 [Thermoplasmatales archaeon]|nr:MAG: hypothetical protein RE472_01065 [Thermoplasmatales archaeon]
MNGIGCYGLTFINKKMTFKVCYSHIKKCPNRVPIKGIIIPEALNNEKYAFFQFYKEIFCEKKFKSKWIPDKSNEEDAPYCCISDSCSYRWSDGPKYNLYSAGKILFHTFITEVNENGSASCNNWKYKVLLGFSWGMMSIDGTKIEEIPIKNIDRSILKELVCLLQKSIQQLVLRLKII